MNKQIMAGKYEGIIKTRLDGFNQIEYLTGKTEKSNRDTFFYYQGRLPSAVRYKNWKFKSLPNFFSPSLDTDWQS